MRRVPIIAVLAISCCLALAAATTAPAELFRGQTLYVPAYSHIYHGPKSQPFELTCTLSVRNTDMDQSITITAVDYYDSKGQLVRRFLDGPVELGKLETREYIIHLSDSSGGAGANFIVVWEAGKAVNAPLVETVMIGTKNSQGLSFTSRAQPITAP